MHTPCYKSLDTLKFLLLLILILVTFISLPSTNLYANPIPVPVAPLLSEDIDIIIWVEDGFYVARVDGFYELGEPIGFNETMILRFPVPQDSWNVTIYVDERSVSFDRIRRAYVCRPIEESFDILEWTTSKGKHSVRIVYTHRLLDLGNGTYLLIYAIGSSKLIPNAAYAKGCKYKVSVKAIPSLGSKIDFEFLERDPITSTYIWVKPPISNLGFKLEGILSLENMFDDLYVKLTSKSEKWIPYKPKPEELGGSEISVYDRCINVTVKFIFKHSGFKIESRYNTSHRYVRFDFYVYEWTGVTLPVLTEKICTITAKPLDPGVYYVQLFISNIEVAALEVAIPDNEESHPSYQEGDLQAILSLAFIGLILLALTVMVVASIYGWTRL
jgi:hypothetical protein